MNAQTPSGTQLQGRWLVLARAAWLALAVLTWAAFLAALPVRFNELRTVSVLTERTIAQLVFPDLSITDASALSQIGLSVDVYAAYFVLLDALTMVVFFAAAAVLFWRKSDERIAWLVSLALLTFGAAAGGTIRGLPATDPLWGFLPVRFVDPLAMSLTLIAVFIFPDGRFVPRWTRWPALLLVVVSLVAGLTPASPFALAHWPLWLITLFLVVVEGSAIGSQIYRYARISDAVQRQQTKWVVFGMTAAIVARYLLHLPPFIIPTIGQSGLPRVLWSLLHEPAHMLFLLLVPLTFGIAVLRYRLWNIDLVINRTLVYVSLTVIVGGLYTIVVAVLGKVFQAINGSDFLLSLLATAFIAVLFQPLRDRLQRGVNRLMYGERDDPVTVLSRLGRLLETTLAPNAVLPNVVETVAVALKLPYAAIALKQGDQFEIATRYGRPIEHVIRLPLVYQSQTVGELLVAPRAPGEGFTLADRRLLDDLARQAGVAVHAVRLTSDLQRLTFDLQQSRERLVTMREEERRRLRRDLHDGIGPTLASLAQRLDTARSLVAQDPDTAVVLLGELKTQVKATISDIRRLVYALRPPALDEFGLVAAIREHTAQFNQANGLCISVVAPDRLLPLPAAVEVAAYRIVLEALTNVAHHAQARHCQIGLELTSGPALCLEITDDGKGLPTDCRAGVGLSAMRERAAELGGECRITREPLGGTRVWARLPLPKE